MRCRLCTHKAVYAPLRFCKVHFLAYYEKKVRTYLEKNHIKNLKVLVAVSGGKDSAATASVLKALQKEFNLELSLFVIHLQIPGYSDPEVAATKELAKLLDMPITVWDLKDYPKQIPAFTKAPQGRTAKPCSQCGVIKRYLLNKAAIDLGYDYIATGHNLDDEHYFMMHSLEQSDMVQLLRSEKHLLPKQEHKLAGRIKPLYGLTEKENMIYCILKGLPIHNQECPFSVGNPQLTFKLANAQLGREKKISLLNSIKKIKKLIPKENLQENTVQLNDCPKCGFTTTREDACVYCKIMAD